MRNGCFVYNWDTSWNICISLWQFYCETTFPACVQHEGQEVMAQGVQFLPPNGEQE